MLADRQVVMSEVDDWTAVEMRLCFLEKRCISSCRTLVCLLGLQKALVRPVSCLAHFRPTACSRLGASLVGAGAYVVFLVAIGVCFAQKQDKKMPLRRSICAEGRCRVCLLPSALGRESGVQ